MQNVKLAVVFFFCSHFLMIAQSYVPIDTMVDTYPKSFQSIEAFGNRIQKDFTEDADRVRAAYYWIATHITYDYKSLETGINGYPKIEVTAYKDEKDYHAQYKKIYASHVLNYKTGVCAGYARLLFYVCEYMGIKAKIIIGNGKNSLSDVGRIPRGTNHAWNAVFFNDKWNLIDATWSTGNYRDEPNYFDFSDRYFCISPDLMILSHFPKDSKWQLLPKKLTKKHFFTRPLFHVRNIDFDMILSSDIRGTIRPKNGYIILKFDSIDTTKTYFYSFKNDEYGSKLELKKVGKKYVVKIPYKKKGRNNLTLSANTKPFLKFKIIPAR